MLPSLGDDGYILRKNKQKRIENATNASVRKEMAQPRMAKSARDSELKVRTAGIRASPKAPSATDKKSSR
jgi:hypothetical protein